MSDSSDPVVLAPITLVLGVPEAADDGEIIEERTDDSASVSVPALVILSMILAVHGVYMPTSVSRGAIPLDAES